MKWKLICNYLLLLTTFTACKEDTTHPVILPENHPVSNFKEITVREVFDNDGLSERVTGEKKFIYDDGRLVQYIYTQSFYPGTLSHNSQMTYSDYQATLTDEFGNISVYTLNDRGHAISCMRQNETSGETREYTFDYTEDKTNHKYLLSEINESIDNKLHAQILITYADLGSFDIKLQVADLLQTYTATQSDDRLIGNISELPDLFLCETYPLSLHEAALYGKLLGDPYPVLITQLMPEGGTEITRYAYECNDADFPITCIRQTTIYDTADEENREATYSRKLQYSYR